MTEQAEGGVADAHAIRNDFWTLNLAQLGCKAAGDQLTELILTCHPPYAICVQGKWGSGKTSMLRYAMAKLGGEPIGLGLGGHQSALKELPSWLGPEWNELAEKADEHIVETLVGRVNHMQRPDGTSDPDYQLQTVDVFVLPVWFNPWQHRESGDLVIALLQEIRAQYSAWIRVRDKGEKLTTVAIESGLNLAGSVMEGLSSIPGAGWLKAMKGLSAKGVREVGEAYERRNFDTQSDAQRINLLFEQAIRRLLGDSEDGTKHPHRSWRDEGGRPFPVRRLVVFIDDLDRCGDEQAIHLLEAIKLYLQTPYCVFVFGMDTMATHRALAKVVEHDSDEARAYIDKLFQSTLFLPVPQREDRVRFLEGLIKDSELAGLDDKNELQKLTELIDELVEPNPRRLKNFVNSLAVAWHRARDRLTSQGVGYEALSAEKVVFTCLHYLRHTHPDIYRLLEYDPDRVVDLQHVIQGGRVATQTSPEPIRKFIAHRLRFAFDTTVEEANEAYAEAFGRQVDRHRSDRAFVQAWTRIFEDENEDRVRSVAAPFVGA